MRVAALYDIHGNLPALDAVLVEVYRERVDQIVIGGDVFPGPMPVETIERLLAIEVPVEFICHTHVQFDRRIGNTRVVNAGSVGMPFQEPGAYWLLIDGEIQLRRTI